MPTNLLHTTNSFLQEDVIHASDVGLQSRRALTVDPDKIAPDANGKKIVRPGTILYKIPGADLHRVGLRARLAAAVTASSTTSLDLGEVGVIYQSKAAQYFAPGDVVKVLRPFATITFAGTWAADNELTLIVNGITTVIVAGSTTLATIAANVAAAINADSALNKIIEAVAAGAVVSLFSTTSATFTASATEDAAGTATVSAVTSSAIVGTIDTAGVNAATGTVTLTAAAAVSLPIGAPIGVEGEPWGLILGAHDAGKADNDIAGFTGGAMYGERIPYWDGDIAEALDNIYFV